MRTLGRESRVWATFSPGAAIIRVAGRLRPTPRYRRYVGHVSPRLTTLALVVVLAACSSGVAAQDVPPAGQMWFGQSFDPSTFAMTGKTSTVGTQQPVALVAHLTRDVGSGLTIRASHDGTFVTSAPVTVNGSGDVFGYVLGALIQPGAWRYDVVDVGGNVLASGTVNAT